MTVVRRAIGSLLSAALAAAGVATTSASPAAAEDEPIVVNGVVRDNVDNTHSPRMTAQLIKDGVGTPRLNAADAEGIDVASHQHPNGAAIDWTQVAGAGKRFTAIKATEGDYYTNPYYAGDRSGAAAAGMYTFPYHFAIPHITSGTAQADLFLDHANYQQDGRTLPPALDLEHNPYNDGVNACYNLTPSQMIAWIRDFLNQVKRRTGVNGIIYTGANWWNMCTGGTTAFADHPLWVASYNTTPTMPTGWPDYTIWQYSSTGTVPGIAAGAVDLNTIRGGEATLAALATRASEPAGYTPTDPVRVLDTRNATGVITRNPIGTRGSITLDLSLRLPASATAVVLNVTAITTATTFVTVWPNGTPRPAVSNLNLDANDIRSNLVTVQVPADRKVRLFNNSGDTHLLADLAGWYATDATDLHTPRDLPQRVLDTRSGAPIGQGATHTLDLSHLLPTGTTAVTLTLTGVSATRSTFVSAWPAGQSRPVVSNLNLTRPDPTAILVTVKVGADRRINLYNHSGTVHLLADLAGYYAPGSGSKFVAVAPRRLLDTRVDRVTWVQFTATGAAVALNTFRPGSTGTVLNVTGVAPETNTYVTVFPKVDPDMRPGASNLNLVRGQTTSNLVSTAVSDTSELWMFNGIGAIDLIADLAGYFVPPTA